MKTVRVGVVLICVAGLVAGRGLALDASQAEQPPWSGPPAILVSAERNEPRFVYNTANSVSGDGGFVVWWRSIKDYPARLWIRNLSTGNKRVIARPHKGYGWRRVTEGRYRGFGYKLPDVTPDGSKIFFSSAYRLVPEDRNRYSDVYLYDRHARTYVLISVGSDGRPGDSAAYGPSASDDGRFVAFSSASSDLVPDDTNRTVDIFVRDLQEGTTSRVSVANDGSQGERSPVEGWDRSAYGASFGAAISSEGTRVAFVSHAANLVPDDTNAAADAFVRDLTSSTTTRVSVSSTGEQLEPFEYCESASCFRDGADAAEISGDGDTVVFRTHANGLVEDDDNDNVDIYAHDLSTGITERVSEPTGGGDAYPEETRECGNNGQCFTFITSSDPSVSHDGNRVYFLSGAPDMTDEDNDDFADKDVFVHDRTTGVTQLVNRRRDGSWALSHNIYAGSISADGHWVTYSSDARRVAPGQRGGNGDVFLQELDDASFGS